MNNTQTKTFSLKRVATIMTLVVMTFGVIAAVSPVSTVNADTVRSAFVGQTPVRLIDTRSGAVSTNRGHQGRMNSGDLPAFKTGHAANVPVALTVTAIDPSASGWIAIFPCESFNGTSTLNFDRGDVTANTVIVKPAANGLICIRVGGQPGVDTHVAIDLMGSFDPSDAQVVNPRRLVDTRASESNRAQNLIGKVAAGRTVTLTGFAPNSTPILNMTTALQEAPGYLQAFPCAQGRPSATSNTNFLPWKTKASLVTVKADNNGLVCVYTKAATHLVVDSYGQLPANADIEFFKPQRIVDTRNSNQTEIVGRGNGYIDVRFAGAKGRAVAINVTAATPQAPGHVTVHACGTATPVASMLNYAPWTGPVPNMAYIQPRSSDGCLRIWTKHGRSDVVVDLYGYLGKIVPTTTVAATTTTTKPATQGTTVPGPEFPCELVSLDGLNAIRRKVSPSIPDAQWSKYFEKRACERIWEHNDDTTFGNDHANSPYGGGVWTSMGGADTCETAYAIWENSQGHYGALTDKDRVYWAVACGRPTEGAYKGRTIVVGFPNPYPSLEPK